MHSIRQVLARESFVNAIQEMYQTALFEIPVEFRPQFSVFCNVRSKE